MPLSFKRKSKAKLSLNGSCANGITIDDGLNTSNSSSKHKSHHLKQSKSILKNIDDNIQTTPVTTTIHKNGKTPKSALGFRSNLSFNMSTVNQQNATAAATQPIQIQTTQSTNNINSSTALQRISSSNQLMANGTAASMLPHNNTVATFNLSTSNPTQSSMLQQFNTSVQTATTPLNAISNSKESTKGGSDGTMSGYLYKWTNYIKGYQKRWFNLSNGLLSYYRSPTEMTHTCRGTINLANASILSEDSCHFVVSNGGAQTFHLKAGTESEKQKWVAAIELAKNRAKQENLDSDEDTNTEAEKNEVHTMLKTLQTKLEDLNTCHDLVQKHSGALTKSLIDLESIQNKPDENTVKQINERATLFKITLLAMINACQEFTQLANLQGKKMQKVLQSERDIRAKLEDMVQEMAKTQSNIESQITKRTKRKDNQHGQQQQHDGDGHLKNKSEQQQGDSNGTTGQIAQDHVSKEGNVVSKKALFELHETDYYDDFSNNGANDDEFHDALEDVTVFPVTMPKQSMLHRRQASNLSKLDLQESEPDSDEEDQSKTTIKVTMHKEQNHTGAATSTATVQSQSQEVAIKQQQQKSSPSSQIQRQAARKRRKEIPQRPNFSLNLWGVMKNCIGKDLSKIPIPVNFSEPISMLQRMTEELEYSDLLDAAAACDDQWEQMAYVAAFTVSAYSTTATRTNKPFNPLLGETYECDRTDDLGWRSMAEQVTHHPPGLALHAESVKDWKWYQEFVMSSKFRGQYLQVIPMGTSHLEFKKNDHHYTWRKVHTFVRNIIVGKLWIDNVGEMDIINHKTKDVCHLKYFAYSYFSRETPRKVTGIITDSNNVARYVLNGTWTEQIEGAPVLNPQVVTDNTQLNTGASKVLWRRRYPPASLEPMYSFTQLAIELNEPEEGVAPTDSRHRPDQRLMEQALWDEANKEKLRLEEKQRIARKQRESLNEKLAGENKQPIQYESQWFRKTVDPYTNQPIHVFNNEYWECKQKSDWKRCPNIF